MNKYKFVSKKGVSRLVVDCDKKQQTTEREIYAIRNGEIGGLLPVDVVKKGAATQLVYDLDGCALLADFLAEPLDQATFSTLLSSILGTVKNVKEAFFNPESLLLDANYVFVEPQSGQVRLVYVPLTAYDCETDLRQLLQKILGMASFDPGEDTEYVRKYIEILNSGAAFSVFEMEQYAAELESQIYMNCPGCGKKIRRTFRFCPGCGAAVEEEPTVQVDLRTGRGFLFRESTGEWIEVGEALRIGKSRVNNDYAMPTVTTVSRNHAVIEGKDGTWQITDLGSTNGTFINGREIPAHTQTAIAHGDKLCLANENFIFEIKD